MGLSIRKIRSFRPLDVRGVTVVELIGQLGQSILSLVAAKGIVN